MTRRHPATSRAAAVVSLAGPRAASAESRCSLGLPDKWHECRLTRDEVITSTSKGIHTSQLLTLKPAESKSQASLTWLTWLDGGSRMAEATAALIRNYRIIEA